MELNNYAFKGGINLLKNTTLLIMGGDRRHAEAALTIANQGVNVHLVGFGNSADKRLKSLKKQLVQIDFTQVDAILVPISGVGENGLLDAPYSDEKLFLSTEKLALTPKHCVIYTGNIPSYLKQLAETTDKKIIPLFARDDLAILNSIPTAEGTLQIAMEHTDFTIHGSEVCVLGYGKVGKTIARVFAAVGANVSVGVRKSSDRARVVEVGLQPFPLNQLKTYIQESNIIINTIPHLILTREVLEHVSEETLIIDVASKPGGTDFEFAKERGIKALLSLGLPGKHAPKTAGEIMGKVVIDLLNNHSTFRSP